MWNEMSYNQPKLTFSERLEITPDFGELDIESENEMIQELVEDVFIWR